MSPSSVSASLRYLKWQELYSKEKPFQIFINIPEDAVDQRESNLVWEEVRNDVRNIRGQQHTFKLDANGFQFAKMAMQGEELDVRDKEDVELLYLPCVEELLKQEVEGTDEVFIFDWRVRKDESKTGDVVFNINDPTQFLRPAQMVHIDQSPSAVINRIRLQLADRADFLLRGRVRILNVWRPLNHPVENFPLALCDGSTVVPSDLVEADHVRRKYLGSTMYVMHSKRHKWHYLHAQRQDEVTILKNFDSDPSAKAHVAPHVAIELPNIPHDALPRESIEVRALVFTYPKSAD